MDQKTKPSLLIISGWAQGINSIKPIKDAFVDRFDIQLLTGTQVLKDQCIPNVDYLISESMGGLLALERLPKKCKKLVLISSTAKFCVNDEYDCGTSLKVLRQMILQLKRNREVVLSEFFRNVHHPEISPSYIGVDEPLNDLINGLEYLLSSDMREKVIACEIPVLLLHGRKDRIIPSSASEWLHAHLPESQLELFEQAGHALRIHQFKEVIHKISRFL